MQLTYLESQHVSMCSTWVPLSNDMTQAVWRVLELWYFDVQLLGGLVLHKERLAEMKTGATQWEAEAHPMKKQNYTAIWYMHTWFMYMYVCLYVRISLCKYMYSIQLSSSKTEVSQLTIHDSETMLSSPKLPKFHLSLAPAGEGKTIVALLPTFLAALEDKGGVYVVTPNDYLARRDAENVGQVLRFLGLTVGLVQSTMEAQRDTRNDESI